MATVFEDCTTKEQRSVVRFLWLKKLNAKNIVTYISDQRRISDLQLD
jgi:hypothetical protein